MATIHMTSTLYHRLLMLAAVSPILAAIVAHRLDLGSVWPWSVVVPVLFSGWVVRDARRNDDGYTGLWTALGILAAGLWVLFLLLSWMVPE